MTDKDERFRTIITATLIALTLYKLIQWAVPLVHSHFFSLKLPGEEFIPFVPAFIFIYLLIYAVPPTILMQIKNRRELYHVLYVFAVAFLIHAVFYLVIPVKYTLRPVIEEPFANILSLHVQMLYWVDDPYNNYPSMHVTFIFLCWHVCRSYKPEWASRVFITAVAVAFSTLFVKQHYILDVVSAYGLAWGLNKIYFEKTADRINLPTSRIFRRQ